MNKRRKIRPRKQPLGRTKGKTQPGPGPTTLFILLSVAATVVAALLIWFSWPAPLDDPQATADRRPDTYQWEEQLPPPRSGSAPDMTAIGKSTDPIGALIEEVAPGPDAGTSATVKPLDVPPGAQLALPAVPESPDNPAWKTYAAQPPRINGRPQVAIIIDDLGLNDQRTRDTIDLPAPLTLAFLPYAYHLQTYADLARRAGHELLVHMPMEPLGVDADPGPDALLVDMPEAEFKRRLDANLSGFKGYVGINNHMGSRLTTDRPALAMIMAELKQRGLLFLDSRTTSQSLAGKIAAHYGVPHISRDIFLDNSPEPSDIRVQLSLARDMALKHGHVVVIGHPYDSTLDELRRWLRQNNDLAFVPLSQLVAEREKLQAGLDR